MTPAIEKPAWYRIYVLLVLLAVCVCNLATRNLPSYLITVPVPDCEEVCAGLPPRPLCINRPTGFPSNSLPDEAELCQLCRARVLPPPVAAVPQLFSLVASSPAKAAVLGSRRSRSSTALLLAPNQYPWTDGLGQDAVFYNMADGACLRHWEYGILIGYGFAVVFAVGSVPAGWICDRKPRVAILSAALLAWSVATSMQAAAHSFWFLLGCRAVIGLSQAFCMPAAISLAADYFTERQNAAVQVLSMGLYLGSGCASFSILFAGLLGWGWAVLLAGLLGVALTPIVYRTVQEPERTDWSAPCPLSVVTDEVFDKSRVARMLTVAGSAKMLAAYSLSAFLPIWYVRRGLNGYTSTSYACWNALLISLGGLLSTVLGNALGHWGSRRDARAPCLVGLLASVLSVPLICIVLTTPHFGASLFCLFLQHLLGECWFGPTISLLQASVRRSVRGQAVSMFVVASTLAANLGPALVGFLDTGGERLGVHLLWLSITANVVAAGAFMWTAREISIDPVAAGLGNRPEDLQETSSGKAGTAHWALL